MTMHIVMKIVMTKYMKKEKCDDNVHHDVNNVHHDENCDDNVH